MTRKLTRQAEGQSAHAVQFLTSRDWIKTLRIHQWSKNAIIFVPFVLNQQYTSRHDTATIFAGFFLFCMVATSTYLFNDICDVESDRAHPTKRRRAIASGRLPIKQAATIAIISYVLGIVGAFFLNREFLFVLLSYSILTASYSLKLKRLILLDTLVIAVLFMLRVLAGMMLSHQPISMWLCSFAVALFLSLALAKRHDELVRLSGSKVDVGRSYTHQDAPLTISFGVSATMTAILIMILYLTFEVQTKNLYHTIEWLYGIPLVVLSWTQRVWSLANRGSLADDPVVFALRDAVSWYHAAVIGLLWALAVMT